MHSREEISSSDSDDSSTSVSKFRAGPKAKTTFGSLCQDKSDSIYSPGTYPPAEGDSSRRSKVSRKNKEICLVPNTKFCIGSAESRTPALLEEYDIRLVIVLMAENERSEIQDRSGQIEKLYRTDTGKPVRQILYHLIDMPGSNIMPIIDDIRVELAALGDDFQGNILFHCMAGRSRSPSVVIGLMMHNVFGPGLGAGLRTGEMSPMPYHEAYESIMTVREIEPDPCFIYQLASIDRSLKKMEVCGSTLPD